MTDIPNRPTTPLFDDTAGEQGDSFTTPIRPVGFDEIIDPSSVNSDASSYAPPVQGSAAGFGAPAQGSETDSGSSKVDDVKEKAADKANVAKDEAASVKADAQDATKHVAGVTKEQASQVASEAKGQAKELFSQASSELKDQAGVQSQKVAGGLRSIGDELSSMADKSDGNGMATELVRNLSGRAGSAAEWLDGRDPGSLLDEVKSFAARKPGTFIAIAAGAGILAGRLAKSLAADAKSDVPHGSAAHEESSQAAPAAAHTQAAPAAPAASAASAADVSYESTFPTEAGRL